MVAGDGLPIRCETHPGNLAYCDRPAAVMLLIEKRACGCPVMDVPACTEHGEAMPSGYTVEHPGMYCVTCGATGIRFKVVAQRPLNEGDLPEPTSPRRTACTD